MSTMEDVIGLHAFARLSSALSSRSNFASYSSWNMLTTSSWELLAFVVIGFLVLVPFYAAVRATTDKSEKRSAWILTLCCSVVSSVGCLPKVHRVLFTHTWPTDGTDLYSNDRLSRFLVVFFLVYLVVDSVAMLRHYPSIGGLHHHIPYFVFMALTIVYECPGVFVLFYPLEFSTIPLAIGHIWPERRQDLLFGALFFYTRIVYHAQACLHLWRTRATAPLPLWSFSTLPWGVHVYWFAKWVKRYVSKQRATRKGLEAGGGGGMK